MVKRINQMSSPIKILNLTLAPDVKSNKDGKPNTGSNKEHKQDNKPDIKHNKDVKPNIEFDKITYEEEKVALVLGITSIFTVWWMFK